MADATPKSHITKDTERTHTYIHEQINELNSTQHE